MNFRQFKYIPLTNQIKLVCIYERDLERDLLSVVSNTKIKALSTLLSLGVNCIQNVHLGRYIFGFKIGNFILRRHISAKN